VEAQFAAIPTTHMLPEDERASRNCVPVNVEQSVRMVTETHNGVRAGIEVPVPRDSSGEHPRKGIEGEGIH
jgi:hypothetical protein